MPQCSSSGRDRDDVSGACGSGGISSPTAPTVQRDLTLTGTWTGITGPGPRFVWRLTQEGNTIAGFSTLPGAPGFPSTLIDGAVSGTVNGTRVTIRETFPAGTLSVSDCALERSSTLEGSETELRGTMSISGCLGAGSVSVVVTRQDF